MILPGLSSLALLVFLYNLTLGSAAVYSVPHDDPRISYIPSVCDLDCTRVCRNQWWLSCLSNGAASHRTKGNQTESSFTFRGGKITWYTRIAPDGGKATVWIDAAQPQSVNTNSPITVESFAIYTKDGLDPTRDHRISVVYDTSSFVSDTERFVDIHHFEYDDEGSTAVVGSASSSGQSLSPSQPSSGTISGATTQTTTATTGHSTSSQGLHSAGASQPGTLASLAISLGSDTGSSPSAGSTDSVNVANFSNSSSQKLSPGAIVGVVFGALGFLLLTAIFFWYARQRKRPFTTDYDTKQSFKHREIPDLDNDKDSMTYGREQDIELYARGAGRQDRNVAHLNHPPSQSHLSAEDSPESVINITMSSRETLSSPVPRHVSSRLEDDDKEESEIEQTSIVETEPVSRREPTPQTLEGARSRKLQMMNGSRTAPPSRQQSRPRSPNTDYSGSGTRMSTGGQWSPMDDLGSSQSRIGRQRDRISIAMQSSIRGETPPPSYVQ